MKKNVSRAILIAVALVIAVMLRQAGETGAPSVPRAEQAANAPSTAVVARVLRMGPADQAALVDRIAQQTGVRFGVTDPTHDVGQKHMMSGLQFVGERVPRVPGFAELHENVRAICTFVAEQMNPTIPETQRLLRVSLSTEDTAGLISPESFGYYLVGAGDNPMKDVIVWPDFVLYASPDIFALLWVHELSHVLVIRTLMERMGIDHAQMKERIIHDDELAWRVEQTAWTDTVEFYGFMAEHHGWDLRRQRRPLVDLLVWDLVIKGALAHNEGGEVWTAFIREHTHRPPPGSRP